MVGKKLFHKDFLLVVIGQIISLFGNSILRFALPLYLLRTTGSAALFGMVTACSFLPMIFLSFIGGVLADRVNKRNIMVALDFSTALLILIFSLLLGKAPVVPLFIAVLMLLYGISGAYQPAVQASIPFLAEKERIVTASAIINQISAFSNLIGPVLGGILYGAFGITPILLLSIFCFFLSAAMELFITIPFEKKKDTRPVTAIIAGDLKESFTYMRKEKPILIRIITLLAFFNLILSSMIIIGMPVIVVETLHLSDALLGSMQGVAALGSLGGGALTAALGTKLKLKNSYLVLLLCSILAGGMAAPLFFGAPALVSYAVINVLTFGLMLSATVFTVRLMSAVQMETPPQLVGKVIACMMAVSMCAQPLGQAIYGILFDALRDTSYLILIGASLISLLLSLFSRNLFQTMETENPVSNNC